MIKESLFAAEEREAKLDKLGDIFQGTSKNLILQKRHIDESIAYKDIFHEINGVSNFPSSFGKAR